MNFEEANRHLRTSFFPSTGHSTDNHVTAGPNETHINTLTCGQGNMVTKNGGRFGLRDQSSQQRWAHHQHQWFHPSGLTGQIVVVMHKRNATSASKIVSSSSYDASWFFVPAPAHFPAKLFQGDYTLQMVTIIPLAIVRRPVFPRCLAARASITYTNHSLNWFTKK